MPNFRKQDNQIYNEREVVCHSNSVQKTTNVAIIEPKSTIPKIVMSTPYKNEEPSTAPGSARCDKIFTIL